ncbi:MAG: DUF1622 domain-containing protein [Thermoleophilaceae bacterium]|jgi:uncharacterized membrane protein|nr:DUF1622 domain-containing protein [Thermoleophilaceae bacterium]
MEFKEVIETVGKVMDGAGVAVIVVGVLAATVRYAGTMRRESGAEATYRSYRQGVGKAILLGLEILVAADIIRTVAVSPTFTSAGVLAIIVVIRTFLSLSLQVELEGGFPWQSDTRRSADPAAGGG